MQAKYFADEYGIVDAVQVGYAKIVELRDDGLPPVKGCVFKVDKPWPGWLKNAIDLGDMTANFHAFDSLSWDVKTPYGIINASKNDWIVRSKHNVLNVYTPDAFKLRFKLAIL